MTAPLILSLIDARVLGVLVEKQRTVPDTYPLTLNALVSGCNQKTSRDPVMTVDDAEVQSAIDHLKSRSLVIESSGGRVYRYAHNVGRVLLIPAESVALLAVLLLRGPQTAGELRLNCERLQRFADISSVEGFLHELAEWPAGPLVTELPRQPGSRENRWAHLLSGAPAIPAIPAITADALPTRTNNGVEGDGLAALQNRVGQLENEVAELKLTVARLRADAHSSD